MLMNTQTLISQLLTERRTVITDIEVSHYPPVAVVVCERT